MRAQIRDVDALRAINPSALAAFVRSHGWQLAESYGEHSDVYIDGRGEEVIAPRTKQIADYPQVISKLIEYFSAQLEQDEFTVYRTLVGADHDVVRFRAIGAEEDGSIDLEKGVNIVAQSKELVLAAACAVVRPRPVYRSGANKDAVEYVNRVRLGQTEHGSFIVNLLAPVPPLLQPRLPLDNGWAELESEPFERKTTRMLLTALKASKRAAEQAVSNKPNAFEDAVVNGVSANFCAALANLISNSDGLDISLAWSKTRPAPEPLSKVSFSESDAEIFSEAARLFKSQEPRPDLNLYATVHKLKRDYEETDGLVTFRAMIDDRVQSILAELDMKNYHRALQAHDDQKPVTLSGDLERVGSRWHMSGTRVEVAESPDDDDLN